MSTRTDRTTTAGPTNRSAAVPILRVGLATSALTMLAVVVDQAAIGSIAAQVVEVYRGYGNLGDGVGSLVVTLLLALGAAGVIGWLWTLRGATRGRRWVRPVGTSLFVVGTASALLLLTATEYGRNLVPTWLGLLGLLPCVVGLVALVPLWRGGRR